MTETPAPRLEFRRCAKRERVVGHIRRREALEESRAADHALAVLGVVRPVRGDMKNAAALEDARDVGDEIGLNDPPLVVPFLRPGIGKEQIHGVEGAVGKHPLDDVDGVAVDDANIRDARALDQCQQMTQSRLVHLDAEVVDLRECGRGRQQGFAVAEADIENARRLAAEDGVEIEPSRAERDAEAGQQALEGTLLARRDAPRAAHEAPDPAGMIDIHCAILGKMVSDTFSRFPGFRAGAALVAALFIPLAGCGDNRDATPETGLRYDTEYPGIPYSDGRPGDRLGRLTDELTRGKASLDYAPGRGYLDAALAALDIDVSSQVLVFSRTSVQGRQVDSKTPRAIYFNDDTYVAWVPGAPTFELASFDPELGPVFYDFAQDPGASDGVERELARCLRCHDTYGLSGGGVPRFLLGSGYTGPDGELVSHEAWILTDQSTPLKNRWGGWYVTGREGKQAHLGNMIVASAADLENLDRLRVGNVEELGAFFDTSRYPTPYSDIVALMVLEHQVEVQNLLSRVRFETAGQPAAADAKSETLDRIVEPLVEAMLMLDEAPLSGRIEGGSGFAERFESLGPFDSSGRSLRQLDLETRLFKYPLSYLIYSEPFAALPDAVEAAVFARLRAILAASPAEDGFDRLSLSDRRAIAAILRDTLPAVFAP